MTFEAPSLCNVVQFVFELLLFIIYYEIQEMFGQSIVEIRGVISSGLFHIPEGASAQW